MFFVRSRDRRRRTRPTLSFDCLQERIAPSDLTGACAPTTTTTTTSTTDTSTFTPTFSNDLWEQGCVMTIPSDGSTTNTCNTTDPTQMTILASSC